MTDLGLIIPISVEALCMGNPDHSSGPNFRGATADFSVLPYWTDKNYSDSRHEGPYTSDRVLAATDSRWSVGVHLHWALPDALTHGRQNDSGDVVYPPVPNRWLVTRIQTQGGNVVAHRCWVIESDLLSKSDPRPGIEPPTATVPVYPADYMSPSDPNSYPAGLQPFRYLGKVYDYESWRDGQGQEYVNNNTTPYQFTAVCYGNPTFAAYYPNCCSVFGFYDDLAGIDNAELSYSVVGWYSNANDDPLNGASLKPAPAPEPSATDLEQNTQKAQAYADYLQYGPKVDSGNWLYQEDNQWLFSAPDAGNAATYSLCGGVIKKVEWNRNRQYLGTVGNPSTSVAIGNNTVEALSAKIRASLEGQNINIIANIEEILNALQLGVLDRLDQPGGQAEFEQALHQSYFGSDRGGSRWLVKRKDDSEAREVVLSDSQASLLDTLNAAQAANDRREVEIRDRHQQIFMDWYSFQVFKRTADDDIEGLSPIARELRQDPQQVRDLVNQEIHELTSAIATYNSQTTAIQNQVNALNAQISSDYELVAVPDAKYWHGNELAVLLSGDLIEPALRYGGDGRLRSDGYLEDRLTSEVLSSKKLQLEDYSNLSHYNAIAALVAEAALVAISNGIPSPGNGQKSPSQIGVTQWQTPWLPILLDWQVDYWPVQLFEHSNPSATYTSNFITGNYQLDSNQTDLTPNDSCPHSKVSRTYKNTVILSQQARIDLDREIVTYLANHTESNDLTNALRTVQSHISNLNVLAQGVGGLNQALIMRHQTLQLGISDPLFSGDVDAHFWRGVAQVASLYNGVGPLWYENYSPIRAGSVALSGLTLYDTFGQIAELDYQNLVVANGLQRARPNIPGVAQLTPRLTQPARLLFEWISAKSDRVEVNELPSSTPVCGWVLFNHLDDSLVIYDNQGSPIGSLILNNSQNQIVWQGVPGTSDWGQSIQDAFSGKNAHLRDFAIAVYNNGASFLKSLLLTIDRSLATTLPQNSKADAATALLISRPLALVRTSLQLELQGFPACSQSWEAFQAAAQTYEQNGGTTPQRNTAQFQNVEFPIRLGDLTNINDGLVGYFISDNYETFYAPAADGSDPDKISPPGWRTLQTNSQTSSSLEATMLIDPRAKVHATTGILPAKAIELTPDRYAEPLARMEVTFLAAPVLSSANKLSFPVPKEGSGKWFWIEREADQIWRYPEIAKVNPKVTMSYSPQKLTEGWLQLAHPATIASQLNLKMGLGLENGSTDNGTHIVLSSFSGNGAEQWRLVPVGDDYFLILSMLNPNKALDLSAGNANNNTPIIIWDLHGGNNQQWKFVDDGDGYCNIVSKVNSSKALNVSGGYATDNARIILWDSGQYNNEKWIMEPVNY